MFLSSILLYFNIFFKRRIAAYLHFLALPESSIPFQKASLTCFLKFSFVLDIFCMFFIIRTFLFFLQFLSGVQPRILSALFYIKFLIQSFIFFPQIFANKKIHYHQLFLLLLFFNYAKFFCLPLLFINYHCYISTSLSFYFSKLMQANAPVAITTA